MVCVNVTIVRASRTWPLVFLGIKFSSRNYVVQLVAPHSCLMDGLYLLSSSCARRDLLALLVVQEGVPEGLTVSKTVQVIVGAVNDAPVIKAPLQLAAEEDTLVSMNGIFIADPDCDDTPRGVLEVTVAAVSGTVEFRGSVAGLYLMETLTGYLKIRGKTGPINAALIELTYLGSPEFQGEDVVVITADDLGNSGEGGTLQTNASITVVVASVNDPPRLSAPSNLDRPAGGALFVAEDQPISIGNFGVADPDDVTVRVRTSARFGAVSTDTVGTEDLLVLVEKAESHGGTTASSVTFEGATEEVSAALTTLTYTGPLNWNSVADDRDLVKVSPDGVNNTEDRHAFP